MSKRHFRDAYYMVGCNQVRGHVGAPGTTSPRGCVSRAPSSAEKARSFRFSELVNSQSQNPSPTPSDALIEALADHMTRQIPDIDSHIPAGFTYLGQFVDHDLTKDTSALGTGPVDPTQLISARSPALDLDSLYGRGPLLDPQFYAADKIKFKLGSTVASGPASLPPATVALDAFDLPRKGASAIDRQDQITALIPDERNDENLAVGQTHLAFMRFHNSVCEVLEAHGRTPSTRLFHKAREWVIKHYQWMLKTDFLPRIIDPAIVDDVFCHGRKIFEVQGCGAPTMPIEFSVAAYRLGHSMIRDKYNWNAAFSPGGAVGDFGTLANLFVFSGTSGTLTPGNSAQLNERLPSNWIADWTRLYDFKADGFPELAPEGTGRLNHARPLDVQLTDPLKLLPLGSFGSSGQNGVPVLHRNLAFRNLTRGRMVGLASGQEVAAFIQSKLPKTPTLTRAQILGNDLTGLSPALQDELATSTPLWFYILREAALNQKGSQPGTGRLGAVGGRIVAEVFHRAMESSSHSIVRDPCFRPTLGHKLGQFRMTDLLQVAYDATQGELRPLSPQAPRPPQRPAGL